MSGMEYRCPPWLFIAAMRFRPAIAATVVSACATTEYIQGPGVGAQDQVVRIDIAPSSTARSLRP
jgi:hypothetical protein